MNTVTTCRFIAALLLFFVFSNSAMAQNSASASGTFSVQGRLTNTAGTALADGAHQITVSVYAAGSSTAMFTQTSTVNTLDGVFSLMVGANGTDSLHAVAGTNYQVGIAVDGQSELQPRIDLGSTLSALTADVAADANTVGGIGVSTSSNPLPNTLVALNGQGRLQTSLLDSNIITSINGLHGAVNLQVGNGLALTNNGGGLNLAFTGTGGAGFSLPFSDTTDLTNGAALNLTNTLNGSVASFINSGTGNALNVSATTGAAISATATGLTNAAINAVNNTGNAINASTSAANGAAINAVNTGGAAINAVATNATGAAIQIRNTASAATANLLTAVNAAGSTMLNVAANGQTTINSSVNNALNVTTSAAGSTALSVTGGLTLNGPVGTGTITAGQLSTTINNVLVKPTSVIMITATSTGGITVPLAVASQANGSFVVSVVSSITSLLANASFNYLIIN